ncbi:hypothetical protein R1sor_002030 [Riccia sorocarpa]|uniref:Endonuclease/exonuclease/phosphatase domain-containing protein n=1 Tax=Riccia sorocarpa TaxID=122646 RepID=A0ABD3GYF8_9MARC
MKVGEETLLEKLEFISRDSNVVVDYIASGRGGAAIVCPKHIRIVEMGVSGNGDAAWVKVETSIGVIGIISLHIPNRPNLRKRTWCWMRNLVKEGRWIFGGDFNMVEFDEDNSGPTARLEGSEYDKWHAVAREADLIDIRLTAIKITGPHYTKQVKCGDRFDQARLDRLYLTERGEWVNEISSITTEAVRQWRQHPWIRDPRKRWNLAWGRVRRVLISATKGKKIQDSKLEIFQEQVETY